MNPRKVQSFYPRLSLAALSFLRRPSGYLGGWEQQAVAYAGRGARYMGIVSGPAQKQATTTWASIANGATAHLACAQFLSDPLVRQTVEAGDWIIAMGGQVANAVANYFWWGDVGLFVIDGRTGQKRATIINHLQTVGTSRVLTTERTARQTIAGLAFEIFTGDYLCLELGIAILNNTGAARTPTASLYADGATPILIDNAATADAQTIITAPTTFTLSLPQPGEPPDPSVTSAESVQLMRSALPPNTDHDFDDTSSPDYQLLSWMGESFKRFGHDVVDLLVRELDPRKAVLKLADMRAVFGITQDPPSLPEQRALVLARYREYGGPTSLFGVAAAVGVVLGYDDPSQLEIMQISAAQLETALIYQPRANLPIPEDTDFGATNLIIRTPFVMDGGAIWDAGVKVKASLDAVAGKQVHIRLVGPDGTTKSWSPITRWQEVTAHVLYGKEFSGKAVHGNWTLYAWREVGSPAVTLEDLFLYIAGAPRAYVGLDTPLPLGPPQPAAVPNVVRNAGLGRHKFWWGVYADPSKLSAKTAADFGAARQALGRLRHGYQKADLILSKEPIPTDVGDPMAAGSQPMPDMCVPS